MKRTRYAAAIGFVLLWAASVAAQPVPRAELPRPDFARQHWQTLNGPWEFSFDDQDRGLAERWYSGNKPFARTITVPYCFQSKLSGIGDTSFHDIVWYRRKVRLDALTGRVLLNFGAVDYQARVWVNGEEVGSHRGGNVPFQVDMTDAAKAGDNTVVVRAWDPSTDESLPRGKQYWKPKSEAIWYTRTSGIWQPVWLEFVDPVHLGSLRITPDVDREQVSVQGMLALHPAGTRMRVTVSLNGQQQARSEIDVSDAQPTAILTLRDPRLWSPEHPTLYDVAVELVDANGRVLDHVDSYFGERKVSTRDGRIWLNNAPYYLRMVLDQGYWPDGVLTAPTDDALQYDIKMMKAFGFNGARKHQKVEDPRWLYWCDKLGLIVWGEMANAQEYTEQYVARFTDEWQQVVARDYNHPSIIAWTPLNESWGVPHIEFDPVQQAHAKTMYQLLHSLDATRLVSDNDGWEHTDQTDIFGIHDYARTGEQMAAKYKVLETDRSAIPRNGREPLAEGYRYNGSPIVMTEFGGISYRVGEQKAANEWGYSGIEPTRESMLKRLDGLVKAIRSNSAIAGYCYTQLTDVEQEINGLMTYDRKPKADPAEFKKIFEQ